MDICVRCERPRNDDQIDYKFMRDMYIKLKDKGVEGINHICKDCTPVITHYEGVRIKPLPGTLYQVLNECGNDAGNDSRAAIFFSTAAAEEYKLYLRDDLELDISGVTVREIITIEEGG